jgi:hypothetical protein
MIGDRAPPKRAVEDLGGPVEQKPRIRPGLYNQSIHQGSPVEMQIAALGFPTPTVEWFKDGKPIEAAAGGPDSKISIFTDDRGLHHLVGFAWGKHGWHWHWHSPHDGIQSFTPR